MQLQVGDTVWFEYLASVNCEVLLCGNRRFYIIDYRDLYVAKRGDKVIPLNGYCLCEPIKEEYESEFAKGVTDKFRTDRTVVRYLARPNDGYLPNDAVYGTYYSDNIDVKEGDVVSLRHNFPLYLLERLDMIATFSDEPYYVVQRRYMEIVIDNS